MLAEVKFLDEELLKRINAFDEEYGKFRNNSWRLDLRLDQTIRPEFLFLRSMERIDSTGRACLNHSLLQPDGRPPAPRANRYAPWVRIAELGRDGGPSSKRTSGRYPLSLVLNLGRF